MGVSPEVGSDPRASFLHPGLVRRGAVPGRVTDTGSGGPGRLCMSEFVGTQVYRRKVYKQHVGVRSGEGRGPESKGTTLRLTPIFSSPDVCPVLNKGRRPGATSDPGTEHGPRVGSCPDGLTASYRG